MEKRKRFHKCPKCNKVFYSSAKSKRIRCPECKRTFKNPYVNKGGMPEAYIKNALAERLIDRLLDS